LAAIAAAISSFATFLLLPHARKAEGCLTNNYRIFVRTGIDISVRTYIRSKRKQIP
jgi:hypothetical protein